jgi:hypothetical protein
LAHAYVTFRIHLARHGLQQFAASLKSSGEILVLAGANIVVGLLALSAYPPMYAASLDALPAIALLLAHGIGMTIPLALLRKRLLPGDVVRWAHRMPIAPQLRLRADVAVAALLLRPLALLYGLSMAILAYHHPPWLKLGPGIAATVFSLGLTWCCSIAVLGLRSRLYSARPLRHRAPPPASAYKPGRLQPRLPLLWHRLFWLPYWRAENVVGWQQSVLLAAALACAAAWMMAPSPFMRAVLALATGAAMVLLTDRGDKAVREQTALLRPVLASWPLDPRALFVLARVFSAAPALMVMLLLAWGGAAHGLWNHRAGHIYLVLGSVAPMLLVATPVINQRVRVATVLIEILLLTAVGSELWT